MTGDPDAVLREMGERRIGEPVLRLEGLRAGPAVRGVDLELRRSEIVGLAGLQGQGQVELLEAIAGDRRIDGGTLWHKDRAVSPRRPRDMINRGICLVPDDRRRQGLCSAGRPSARTSATSSWPSPHDPGACPRRSSRPSPRDAIRRLLIKTDGPDQTVSALSGGNQQKVVIGKWLATDVEVMLLSDPTKGVDVHARSEIYAIIGELAQAGTAALVFASDVQELLLHCDRILVMYEGRIVEELSGEAMTEPRVMTAAFGKAAG